MISYDNIITADREGFAKRNYFELLHKMFIKVMSMGSNELLEPVQVAACQLIELALQNCLGTGDKYVEEILKFSMQRMDQHFYGIALPTVLFNVVSIRTFIHLQRLTKGQSSEMFCFIILRLLCPFWRRIIGHKHCLLNGLHFLSISKGCMTAR